MTYILSAMTIESILASIDSEMARLQQVRALLTSESSKSGAGPIRKRRKLSAAARKKIAEAQRKRWAKQKKASK